MTTSPRSRATESRSTSAQTVREAVTTAIGSGSMCWTEAPASVFDSDQAARVADDLCTWLERMGLPGSTPVGSRVRGIIPPGWMAIDWRGRDYGDDDIRAQRADAARLAVDILSRLDDCDSEDVLTVADWLLTGRCDVALSLAAQEARDYGRRGYESGDVGPDAARWSPNTPPESYSWHNTTTEAGHHDQ